MNDSDAGGGMATAMAETGRAWSVCGCAVKYVGSDAARVEVQVQGPSSPPLLASRSLAHSLSKSSDS